MRIVSLASLIVLVSAVSAHACPSQQLWGERHTLTSSDLLSERKLDVRAGGDVNLGHCSSVPGNGYIVRQPDFTISYRRNGNAILRLRVDSRCDTVLLVNDAENTWYYDDDGSPDGSDAEIRIANPNDGYIDVWIGTSTNRECDAALLLKTMF